MTPSHHFDLPAKQTWLVVCVAFWAFGAAAWLFVGRRDVRMRALCDEVTGNWTGDTEHSLWSSPHRGTGLGYRPGTGRPAPRTAIAPIRFVAPDDDPDFLLELDRRIRGTRED